MKTLLLNNRSTKLFFKGSNEKITQWVANHLDEFNLNETHSCNVELWSNNIIIRGDEDFLELIIDKIKPINLKIKKGKINVL